MKTTLILFALLGGIYGGIHIPKHSVHQTRDTSYVDPIRSNVQDTADRIKLFLEKKQSPLAVYAADFAKAADTYRLPPELIIGITNQESSLGKHYPIHTNNPWNWGFCDSCHIGKSFSSIGEGAQEVAKGIATGRHYKKYQQTRDLNDLAAIYLSGDRKRWVAAIEQVREGIQP